MTTTVFHAVPISELLFSTPQNPKFIPIYIYRDRDYGCLTYGTVYLEGYCGLYQSAFRFLYADPTPSALQVFLRRPGATGDHNSGLPAEQGQEEGIWINADPIPGCVVCNIGESKCLSCVPAAVLTMEIVVWEIWTDGLYRSTLHRVVHRGSNYRYIHFIFIDLR